MKNMGFGMMRLPQLDENDFSSVDFEQVIKTSWELGVRRYVAEFWYLDGQDYKAELKKASEFMRSRLDKMN